MATDDEYGGRTATEHLIEQGHTRIAYISNAHGGKTSTRREAGYRDALTAAGITVDPQRILEANGRVDGGQQAMESLLNQEPHPTAVFCYNDLTAIGALKSIVQAGLRVPDDISLVGYDGLVEGTYVNPPLTTVEQPRLQMGKLATQMITDLFRGVSQPTRLILQGRLIERGSSEPLTPE